ncbi:MAG: site-2 protease family protein [Acidobacteriota bacterium]
MSEQYHPPTPQDALPYFQRPDPMLSPEQPRFLLAACLFLISVLTTIAAGFFWHVQFVSTSAEEAHARLFAVLVNPLDIFNGIPFSFTLLAILLAHEMGHYLTCRYYGIKATLPYVIPAPPPINPFGTFGAVIRIKSLFRDSRQLFDVGIAGPLAGFVFIVPAAIVGLQWSEAHAMTEPVAQGLQFGFPLLFQLAAYFFYAGEGPYINLHPIGWAAWFGVLATSMNLLPFGQLDGGHVVYALFGSRAHRLISYGVFAGLILLGLYSFPTLMYLVFAMLLTFIGFRHPRPLIGGVLLGRRRLVVALIGLLILAITFIPVPIRFLE